MRTITKGPEPASLTIHRQTPHADYDNYTDKNGLRTALASEQRRICCYCMSRIHTDPLKMKIEHWHSQDCYPREQLDYLNLLGACRGGQGQPLHLQHCDTRKGNSDLQWNPANPAHHIETRLRYELDGSIYSDEVRFNAQLEALLNLNLPVLKSSRRGVLDGILAWWQREKARIHGAVPSATFRRERARRAGQGGDLEPFCQVAIWWLDQRLARMAR